MKIIVDAMGGDNAPVEIVKGGLLAAEEFGIDVCLVGRTEDILSVLRDEGHDGIPKGIEIANADEVVTMDDNPSTVMRQKKQSSIAVGLTLVAEGKGDAFVSSGNTGALLAGATMLAKRIKGIRRAALAPLIPTSKGRALLIDCGANVECTPEYLLQFAYMGSYYAERVLGMKEPRVGLLNIGTEPTKGAPLQKEAYALLEAAGNEGRLRFVGNVESRDVVNHACDVLVSDGYAGNIFLKTMEGMGLFFIDTMKGMFKKNTLTKLAALLVKDGLQDFKKIMDYNETGGAPLLGIARPVIKAHGSAKAYTVRSAIKQAMDYIKTGMIESIAENIEYMKIDAASAQSEE